MGLNADRLQKCNKQKSSKTDDKPEKKRNLDAKESYKTEVINYKDKKRQISSGEIPVKKYSNSLTTNGSMKKIQQTRQKQQTKCLTKLK